MRVNLHQVRYFLALCEERSFTRAARRCGIAQPSLTQAIQKLEIECGGALFERNRSSVDVTKLGTLVHTEFLRIDQALADLTRKIADAHSASQRPRDNQDMHNRNSQTPALPVTD